MPHLPESVRAANRTALRWSTDGNLLRQICVDLPSHLARVCEQSIPGKSWDELFQAVREVVRSVRASVRTAQTGSADYRKEMMEKRDRLIWAMHPKGMTQEAIGEELGVPRTTVEGLIKRIDGKRSGAKTVRATLNEPLMV